jgi:hypothetical protein
MVWPPFVASSKECHMIGWFTPLSTGPHVAPHPHVTNKFGSARFKISMLGTFLRVSLYFQQRRRGGGAAADARREGMLRKWDWQTDRRRLPVRIIIYYFPYFISVKNNNRQPVTYNYEKWTLPTLLILANPVKPGISSFTLLHGNQGDIIYFHFVTLPFFLLKPWKGNIHINTREEHAACK